MKPSMFEMHVLDKFKQNLDENERLKLASMLDGKYVSTEQQKVDMNYVRSFNEKQMSDFVEAVEEEGVTKDETIEDEHGASLKDHSVEIESSNESKILDISDILEQLEEENESSS